MIPRIRGRTLRQRRNGAIRSAVRWLPNLKWVVGSVAFRVREDGATKTTSDDRNRFPDQIFRPYRMPAHSCMTLSLHLVEANDNVGPARAIDEMVAKFPSRFASSNPDTVCPA